MRKEVDNGNTYIRKVSEKTHNYVKRILDEHEKLRAQIASLEGHIVSLQTEIDSLQPLKTENESLRSLIASQDLEKRRLQKQIVLLDEDRQAHESERSRLQQKLIEAKKETTIFTEQYTAVEQQNSNLANLYVASYRLHSTLDRQEVLAIIQEIIVNLIGSEELGIFELDRNGSVLTLVASMGINPKQFMEIPAGSGVIGSVALSGDCFIQTIPGQNENSVQAEERDLTACIPLKLEGRVIGVIAVFRLLQQKPGLQELDYELFNLLATHASTALYCSGLNARLAVAIE